MTPSIDVVRPRFGLPAVAKIGSSFTIELAGPQPPSLRAALVQPTVSDEQAASFAGPGVHPLELVGHAPQRTISSCGAASAGGYDLLLASPGGPPKRIERAVWLRTDDPAPLSSLRLAHVTDLHLGSSIEIADRFAHVIAAVNRLAV